MSNEQPETQQIAEPPETPAPVVVESTPPVPQQGSYAPGDPSIVGLRIYKPSVTEHVFIKALLYGPPGVGKTTLAASAGNVPEMSKVLLLNIEGGIMAVVNAEEVGIRNTPDIMDIHTMNDLADALMFLARGTSVHGYRTVIIDSLSELAKIDVDEVVATSLGKVSSSGKRRDSLDDIWLEDYGTSTKRMRRLLRNFRDLPMHVIFTSHAAVNKEDNLTFPAITPKLRQSVVGYMDIVAYMYTQAEVPEGKEQAVNVHKILTQPYGRYEAKDRSPGGKIGIIMVNPTMEKIWDKITGEDEDND